MVFLARPCSSHRTDWQTRVQQQGLLIIMRLISVHYPHPLLTTALLSPKYTSKSNQTSMFCLWSSTAMARTLNDGSLQVSESHVWVKNITFHSCLPIYDIQTNYLITNLNAHSCHKKFLHLETSILPNTTDSASIDKHHQTYIWRYIWHIHMPHWLTFQLKTNLST